MKSHTLLSLSPLDGRYNDQLTDLQLICSEYALIKNRLLIEIKWLNTILQLTGQKLAAAQEKFLLQIVTNFSPTDAARIKKIEQKTQHDVKAIEYYIQEQLHKNKKSNLLFILPFIHFGCTSEDINNLAYALMLKNVRSSILLPKLSTLIQTLVGLAERNANIPMLARTHGQPASPTTIGKELINFAYRLGEQAAKLAALEIKGKMNGATGNFNAHYAAYPSIDWLHVSKQFVEELGLTWNPVTTQIEPHDYLAEIANTLALTNTILIGFCRDIWGYIALDYFSQHFAQAAIGSSTMPHKVNPIDFENAEGNLGLANALLQHFASKLPISRWQRDLSDSTVLRNFAVAFGHSVLSYKSVAKGVAKLKINEIKINEDLTNHWEILGEAIQTVLRATGAHDAYEKVKALTRGKNLSANAYSQLVKQLKLPPKTTAQLLALTPSTYIGAAAKITRSICKQLAARNKIHHD